MNPESRHATLNGVGQDKTSLADGEMSETPEIELEPSGGGRNFMPD